MKVHVALVLVLIVLLGGACNADDSIATGRMGGYLVPRQAVDLAAKAEAFLNSAQVAELRDHFADYYASYQATYDLRTRVASRPRGIAEAYLRRYQPGPLPRVFQTTYFYDRHGVRLAELHDEGFRTWVPLAQISPYLIDAVIATEDGSYYNNPGVDIWRVGRALVQNQEAGRVISGASTITMQLARQLFFSPELRFDQTMERKVHEAFLALELTRLYSKAEILEMYLNLVHFGQTAYGVEAASQLYFGKRAIDLTVPEATLLAGMPQKPAAYDLFSDFEAAKQRQRIVLDLMVRRGLLNSAQAAAVFVSAVKLNPTPSQPEIKAPHFIQYLTATLSDQLGEDVRRTGLRIFTTLDLSMQDMAQQIVAEQVAALQPRYDLSNAALVALKPGTAEILVMVGSADFANQEIAGQVNVAVRPRQPGSAIKPVLYATAVNDNLLSAATILWDVEARYRLSRDEEYRPRNYDDKFHGPVTVREALANSYNIPAVKVLGALGIERMLESARAMGLTSLDRDRTWYGLSLTLGGGEVTLLDLTTAYHTLANGGRFLAPTGVLYLRGDSAEENVTVGARVGVPVVSEGAAYVVTDILSDNQARELAFGANNALVLTRPAAAKTGTTSDWRDNWTMGYTRYLVAGVWAGNSDGHPMRNVSGVTGAAPIWHAFMQRVLDDPAMLAELGAPAGEEGWAFVRPAGVEQVANGCAEGVRCRGEELFTEAWLAETEAEGWSAVGDSLGGGVLRTVYVDVGRGRQPLGACTDTTQPDVQQVSAGGEAAPAPSRVLVSYPLGLGNNLPWRAQTAWTGVDAEEVTRQVRQEQGAAVRWSQSRGQPLYVGPCAQVEQMARSIFGNTLRTVAVAGSAPDLLAVSEEEDEPETDAVTFDSGGSGLAALAPPPVVPPSTSYQLMGVAHDNNCGGSYVSGSVSSAGGLLQAGVRVLYRDAEGNTQSTTTSDATSGYGWFRFPLLSDAPQQITVTVVDASGAAISPLATVPHKQGGVTDLGCHYVIWTGVD